MMDTFNTFLPRTLAEAEDHLGISTEIADDGKPLVWYYVETSYSKIGDDSPLGTKFMANLVKASKPKEAERKAIQHTQETHGRGYEVHYFMSRRLTESKAQKILDQFNSGAWEGWRF